MHKTASLLLFTAAACAAPLAHADDWAQLTWSAKWGEGDITYRRDVASTTAADGSVTFADSIAYFWVLGWEFPAMRAHAITGGGGDIITRATTRPGCDPLFEDCRTTELVFRFDNPYPDAFPSWQLNLRYDGPLDATGHLPVSSEGGIGMLLGHLSNNWTDVTLTTLDGSRYPMNRAIAAPVPEPDPLAMLALGAAGAAALARRRRSPRLRLSAMPSGQ